MVGGLLFCDLLVVVGWWLLRWLLRWCCVIAVCLVGGWFVVGGLGGCALLFVDVLFVAGWWLVAGWLLECCLVVDVWLVG